MSKLYVQYGCGLSAPKEWLNFDTSPTLRIQKTPLIGKLFKNKLNTVFPENVEYGDIIKGLPLKNESCNGVYCSHVLEHLSLNDFRKALVNTLTILKPGGIFRCVVPDLEILARNYIKAVDNKKITAAIEFIGSDTLLGTVSRPKKIKDKIINLYGNSNHLWMWDFLSLASELEKAGFKNMRRAAFNDSKDALFKLVEDESRFINALAIECYK